VPEFNPFKYNSFPVNGARQSSLVARRLQAQIDRHAREDRLKGLPPVLTFQSVVDFTVSTRAIVTALYANLPANGSELVLFDLNRQAKFGPLLRNSVDTIVERLLPEPPRKFRATLVTNVSRSSEQVLARTVEAGSTVESVQELGYGFPPGVFSLSHLAIPFPLSDPLYGLKPDTSEDYGANLGAVATRGERGTLIVSIDSLARMSSNPFFDFILQRIDDGIRTPPAKAAP
jgi:alpha-beta hydrolase superfamily lysophospholipase